MVAIASTDEQQGADVLILQNNGSDERTFLPISLALCRSQEATEVL